MRGKTIRVLVVEPDREPHTKEIPASLQSMRGLTGGPIQAVYPFDEPVALVCSEEGKLNGLPLNRALRDESGRIYDIIAGIFFLCGAPPDSGGFESLTPEQIGYYTEMFKKPEIFLRAGGEIIAVPI